MIPGKKGENFGFRIVDGATSHIYNGIEFSIQTIRPGEHERRGMTRPEAWKFLYDISLVVAQSRNRELTMLFCKALRIFNQDFSEPQPSAAR